jgi:hypothetical protein
MSSPLSLAALFRQRSSGYFSFTPTFFISPRHASAQAFFQPYSSTMPHRALSDTDFNTD